ncbi:MAG: YjbQ family protein [Deltaproteobacteria bacterium]|nr:YjbQ family protein [Deltaproteobacteria bacterium]
MLHTLSVRTNTRTEFIDITSSIQQVVRTSGVGEGVCHIYVPHTTAGVTINESADPSVKADILMMLNKLIGDKESYRHLEGNSPAHIKASIIGSQVTVIISGARLLLGTWQGVFFGEFDGPRSRKVHVKICADG